ncbi:MAG: GNAT family N-acetyltransferase [Deferribacteres bacterium]|nr:GNAT family N-acetyltransferase [candidate division KSB1 bacterium]MCB9503623.1 GNAT family N-acetyltransferase [Deferribacteres bacterium]
MQNNVVVSTDPSRLDLGTIHDYLSNQSYWAKNRPAETVEKSIQNSLCFGVYLKNTQIGFARVVTDYSVFAYLLDVFILEQHQGQGIGQFLMQAIMEHPELQGNMLWALATKDAHGLYRKNGFSALPNPSSWMQIDKR